MSPQADPPPDHDDADPVAAYKTCLRALIDRRPSGARRRLAESMGAHPSFVSQILNPALRVPLPVQHLPAVLRACRPAPEERAAFLALYARAHPRAASALRALPDAPPAPPAPERIVIALPDLGSAARRAEVADLIRDFARRVIALAENADKEETPR